MGASDSRLAYADCFELFDQAMASAKGIRIKIEEGPRHGLRIRLHKARAIDRLDNKSIHEEDHVLYGRSVYDTITVRNDIIQGQCYLVLEKIDARKFEVEEIGEDEPAVKHEVEPIVERPTMVRRV